MYLIWDLDVSGHGEFMRMNGYMAIVVMVLIIATSLLAANREGLFSPPSPTEIFILPDVNLSDAIKENESSFRAHFYLVKESLGISNFSIVLGVNDSISGSVRFSDGGRARINDFHDVHNVSLTDLVGIQFTVQFLDEDGDDRVSEWDNLVITCSEALRSDTHYSMVIIWGEKNETSQTSVIYTKGITSPRFERPIVHPSY